MWSAIVRFIKINVASISAFAAMAAVSGAYFIQFGHLGIGDQSKWSEFGGYVGGVVSPLLSFFAFLVLIRSYKKQENDHLEILENGRFFEMLSMLNQMAEGVEVDVVSKTIPQGHIIGVSYVTTTYTGHRGIGRSWNILANKLESIPRSYPERDHELLKDYTQWKDNYWPSVESYYDSAIFIVDRYILGKTSMDGKYCAKVLKSQMSTNERNILIILMSELQDGIDRSAILDNFDLWKNCHPAALELASIMRNGKVK